VTKKQLKRARIEDVRRLAVWLKIDVERYSADELMALVAWVTEERMPDDSR
jgi:hypothetical protein